MKTNRFSPFGMAIRTTAFLLCTPLITASALLAQDRVWSAGTGSAVFDNGSNYTPPGVIAGTADLIFDTATHADLALSAGLAINSLNIKSGANGFILGGSTLTLNSGGVEVASGVNATFNNRLTTNGAATQMMFTVGSGGTMIVNAAVSPIAKPFYKKGAGTLYLDVGMGTNTDNFIRAGASINIEEGTLEIGNAAKFEPGTSFTGNLAVNIGTATTTATLKGGGSFVGVTGKAVTVNTFGSAHSIIQPAGDGTLAIQNLNAASGATFRFELGNALIFGTGTFTGSTATGGLALDLQGGETGVLYTLFQYGTLSGVNESDFLINTAGYIVDFWTISNGNVQVQFAAVPEPSYAGLWLLLAGGIWIARKRRTVLPSQIHP